MRDLLFKNLTSADFTKKTVSCCEVFEEEGMRKIIRRHFVCKIVEVNRDFKIEKPLSQIYVRRVNNSIEHQIVLFYRLKASLYTRINKKIFLILYGHSLRIDSKPASLYSI